MKKLTSDNKLVGFESKEWFDKMDEFEAEKTFSRMLNLLKLADEEGQIAYAKEGKKWNAKFDSLSLKLQEDEEEYRSFELNEIAFKQWLKHGWLDRWAESRKSDLEILEVEAEGATIFVIKKNFSYKIGSVVVNFDDGTKLYFQHDSHVIKYFNYNYIFYKSYSMMKEWVSDFAKYVHKVQFVNSLEYVQIAYLAIYAWTGLGRYYVAMDYMGIKDILALKKIVKQFRIENKINRNSAVYFRTHGITGGREAYLKAKAKAEAV